MDSSLTPLTSLARWLPHQHLPHLPLHHHHVLQHSECGGRVWYLTNTYLIKIIICSFMFQQNMIPVEFLVHVLCLGLIQTHEELQTLLFIKTSQNFTLSPSSSVLLLSKIFSILAPFTFHWYLFITAVKCPAFFMIYLVLRLNSWESINRLSQYQ